MRAFQNFDDYMNQCMGYLSKPQEKTGKRQSKPWSQSCGDLSFDVNN